MIEYIKRFIADDRSFFALLLIVVAVASFGLGRQSILNAPHQPPNPKMQTQTASIANPVAATLPLEVNTSASLSPTAAPFDTTSIQLVASKNGTKYHRLDCPGAKQITDKNKISFDSIAAARAAGYTPAANCKGLE